MVTGKVKSAMGLHKSPPNSKPQQQQHYPQQRQRSSPSPSNSSAGAGKVPQKGAMFSRSFGMYFPRSSAQVQPRPPDVAELLHVVEQLRESESRLRTELLEQKLLKESVAILPLLENEISRKDSEITRSKKMIECLEAENEKLRQEVEMLHLKLTEQKREIGNRIKDLEIQSVTTASQRFQQLMDISGKSGIIKSLKRGHAFTNVPINQNQNDTESSSKVSTLLEIDNLPRLSRCDSLDMATDSVLEVRSRVPRVPKPPPRPSTSSCSLSSSSSSNSSLDGSAERALTEHQPPVPSISRPAPPPPPPPPRTTKAAAPPLPPKGLKPLPAKVRRVPEVVEFYHSLMRRESRRESCNGASSADVPSTANTRDMIGEIENRSTHLLAIKTDVETQGDFIRFLIKEVENASFTDIEDVVPFVKWLDDELSYLVDERAVLKHFDWPEHKADALREAAFGYSDLKKLESEASLFRDDHRQPCAPALKKMQGLFEKLEHGVFNLLRMRESASTRYKVFRIPSDWMQETGFVAQDCMDILQKCKDCLIVLTKSRGYMPSKRAYPCVESYVWITLVLAFGPHLVTSLSSENLIPILMLIKLASVKLAMKYMKRVSAELEIVSGPEEEELIVQGVRFAFRVHQFAGGFDVETMRAFQELRDKVTTCHKQCENQQQPKPLCRRGPQQHQTPPGNIFGFQPRNNDDEGWEDDEDGEFGYDDNEDVGNGNGFGGYEYEDGEQNQFGEDQEGYGYGDEEETTGSPVGGVNGRFRPAISENASPIVPPILGMRRFKSRLNYINVFPQFHGMITEEPYTHLAEFSAKCSTIGDENFDQSERKCPHHQIELWELVKCFVDGLTQEERKYLKSISNGTLLSNPEEEDWDFLERMSQSSKAKASSSRRCTKKAKPEYEGSCEERGRKMVRCWDHLSHIRQHLGEPNTDRTQESRYQIIKDEQGEQVATRPSTGWRVCIDYRKLNTTISKDHFPLPFIDQIIEKLLGHKFYCFLDGYSGYNQFAFHHDDQKKTTFTCPYGTFAFGRMPFGLCNAPATFQRCMMSIFSDMIGDSLEIFMDDFSIFGQLFETCLDQLTKVLKRCVKTNLVLTWEKSHFMVQEGIVLGHVVSSRLFNGL
ncbi:hypothetical protein L1987_56754 [Smallanthus sonchifolius]|uniref:Uncharacterized protein n=1 Tax=Smallanthus sonchifolius TaxID=185202 RepID=A0ACB9DB28_9ASTR|nr:hypothetical protein L1987_56754 [Smallanthus sonchifolius]